MSQSVNIEAEVSAAFSAVREGDLSLTGELVRHGDHVVAHVAPLVNDDDERVRVEAVALLDAVNSESSTKAIVSFLSDTSADIRERAAGAVYRFVASHEIPIPFEPQLLAGLKQDPPSAAALLLLGYAENGELILRQNASDERPVRLTPGGPVVPAKLPATISLSLKGNSEARARLILAIDEGKLETLQFLLEAIAGLDSPEVLHALAEKTLPDQRKIDSGIPAGAKPSRRLRDLAVETFVKRLELEPAFKIDSVTRYSDQEINQLHTQIRNAIPQ